MRIPKHQINYYLPRIFNHCRAALQSVYLELGRVIFGFDYITEKLPYLSKESLVRTLVRYGAKIGTNPKICSGLVIHNADGGFHNLVVGNYCHIGVGCLLDIKEKIELGSNSVVSMRSSIITHTDVYKSSVNERVTTGDKAVSIGEHVYIGAGSTVLMGVEIGHHSIIGAYSLVNKSLPSNVLALGVPARVIRTY